MYCYIWLLCLSPLRLACRPPLPSKALIAVKVSFLVWMVTAFAPLRLSSAVLFCIGWHVYCLIGSEVRGPTAICCSSNHGPFWSHTQLPDNVRVGRRSARKPEQPPCPNPSSAGTMSI